MNEIKKVRKARSPSKEYNTLEEVFEDNITPSERENIRKFKKVYGTVRKALVFISKNRSEKGNDWAISQTYETLHKALSIIE